MVIYELTVSQQLAAALCQLGAETATQKMEAEAVARNVEELLD